MRSGAILVFLAASGDAFTVSPSRPVVARAVATTEQCRIEAPPKAFIG